MSPSSCDETDSEALTVEEALARVLECAQPVTGIEHVDLHTAHGRVLAREVTAPFNVPPHPNSAMDGYALRAATLAESERFHVVGDAFAGHPYRGTIGAGECVRVMTGGVVPLDADTVVQQEHVSIDGPYIRVRIHPTLGANIRHPGEDLASGERVLTSGQRIGSAELGLLASLGFAEVDVHRLPRVAYFSTGDELRGPGEPLGEGDIYDSNRQTLYGLLREIGVQATDLGRIPDDETATRRVMAEAADQADLIVTSGGASVGAADHVTRILRETGQANFWKIAMKPGRPLNFGRLGKALFFGLPGNPVSAMVTFALFVGPALHRLRGEAYTPPMSLRAVARSALRKVPGRTDYQRGMLTQSADGTFEVETAGIQASHILSGMSRANCLIRLPRDAGSVEAGAMVDIIPFHTLFR
ncbi:molybdopterin molybdenumtransferase MoeA [Acidihalobacter yilgarnensis]|uniref:Molybdopterin molybdenumtransferase n=1 Tax=Acidihalobacter yilgarnensis TaxID=2819280 RepID=A0A1D8ISX1_9GAMM|nr:gephyrin-like molybdotransferase Glp [Acidihalobacter yilgarnensis]AOU99591.1 molybdopterin molybdenumtransferase MoeA [Acidihalobacter yilgarnensis]